MEVAPIETVKICSGFKFIFSSCKAHRIISSLKFVKRGKNYVYEKVYYYHGVCSHIFGGNGRIARVYPAT
jgi:hypothetical protein